MAIYTFIPSLAVWTTEWLGGRSWRNADSEKFQPASSKRAPGTAFWYVSVPVHCFNAIEWYMRCKHRILSTYKPLTSKKSHQFIWSFFPRFCFYHCATVSAFTWAVIIISPAMLSKNRIYSWLCRTSPKHGQSPHSQLGCIDAVLSMN